MQHHSSIYHDSACTGLAGELTLELGFWCFPATIMPIFPTYRSSKRSEAFP